MKKKLVMSLALCAVGIAVNVKAEVEDLTESQEKIKFQLDGRQQKIKDDSGHFEISVDEFFAGSDSIKVNIPQYWFVKLYRNEVKSENLVEVSDIKEEISPATYDEYNQRKLSEPVYRIKSGYRLYYPGKYTIDLKENKYKTEKNHFPVKEEERLIFRFIGDDGFWAGDLIYKSSKPNQPEIQEEKGQKENENVLNNQPVSSEKETQTIQPETIASESTNQVSENEADDPNKVTTESNGGEQQSPTSNQSGESVQDQTEDASQKEESSWITHFTSSVKTAWHKVKKAPCQL